MSDRLPLFPRYRRLIGPDDPSSRSGRRERGPAWLPDPRYGDWLIKGIIGANLALYLLCLMVSSRSGGSPQLFRILSPDPTAMLALGATGALPLSQPKGLWTLISASYLHGGVLHLFFNLMALRQIAPWVSREFGARRMFVIYTLSGVGGFLVSGLAGVRLTIGASASVCGLIGALLYFGRSRGGSYGQGVTREVSGWLISLALFGLVIPGINNWGHGGGVVAGMLLGRALGYEAVGRQTRWHGLLFLGCLAATLAVLARSVLAGLILLGYLGR